MLAFALNHMTVPGLRYDSFLRLAGRLGCVGVEFRNDLSRPLFDSDAPEAAAQCARDQGLRIVGLSQVYPFNDWSDRVGQEVQSLIDVATIIGAESISLIPRNDGLGTGEGERQANLRVALGEIKPMLDSADILALVEPLGFESSSLRHKAEAVEIIEALGVADRFKLVHDTFHHHIAGGGSFFPDHTGIVHVSGVTDPSLALSEMADEHRVLVDADDRLGNIDQLRTLLEMGYDGPISYECFSPLVHRVGDPQAALSRSFEFISSSVAEAPS